MDQEGVRAVFAYAQALWPKSHEAGSDAVMGAWGRILADYGVEQVCAALEAMRPRFADFPDLVDIIAAVRELKEPRLRLVQGPWRTVHDQTVEERLREFDAAMHSEPGPFAARARLVMAGEVEVGEGIAEFFASHGERLNGPERLGDLLGSRFAVTEKDAPEILERLGYKPPPPPAQQTSEEGEDDDDDRG